MQIVTVASYFTGLSQGHEVSLMNHLALRLVRVIACERVAAISTAISKTRATAATDVVM